MPRPFKLGNPGCCCGTTVPGTVYVNFHVFNYFGDTSQQPHIAVEEFVPADPGPIREVQTLELYGTITGGTFTLGIPASSAITWSSDNATLLANINAALYTHPASGLAGGNTVATIAEMTAGVGYIDISYPNATTNISRLTFQNSLTGTGAAGRIADRSNYAVRRNQVQGIIMDWWYFGGAVFPTGTFQLAFDGYTTGNISYGADQFACRTNILNALVALPNIASGDIAVQSINAGRAFRVTFQGAFQGTNAPLMTVAANNLNAQQAGTRIAGAEVVLTRYPGTEIIASGTTDADGNLRIRFPHPTGDVEVTVTGYGLFPPIGQVFLSGIDDESMVNGHLVILQAMTP